MGTSLLCLDLWEIRLLSRTRSVESSSLGSGRTVRLLVHTILAVPGRSALLEAFNDKPKLGKINSNETRQAGSCTVHSSIVFVRPGSGDSLAGSCESS